MHATVAINPSTAPDHVPNGSFEPGQWYVALQNTDAFKIGKAYLCVGSLIDHRQYLVREGSLLVEVTAGYTAQRTKFRELYAHETIGDIVK